MSSTPTDVPSDLEVQNSPKHLAFVIDFGEPKSFDTQRHKALVEKFQNRHKRGQSLSKLEELPPTAAPSGSKTQVATATLIRKNSFQSEGYFSCDERGDRIRNNSAGSKNVQYSRFRGDLKLPLKTVNSEKMTQSFPNCRINLCSVKSPELELQDVSSPELELISPFSPLNVEASYQLSDKEKLLQLSSPEPSSLKAEIEIPDANNSNIFVDGNDFDFNKSNTPSDAGTYTLDTDNYTEEQRARMSIDRDFNIEQVSVFQKTEEYIQSLNIKEELHKVTESKVAVEQQLCGKNTDSKSVVKPMRNLPLTLPKDAHERNVKLATPILSPIQTLSITDKIQYTEDKIKKCKEDKGCFFSITASGAFGRKANNIDKTHSRKGSLTKSEIETQMYLDHGYKKKTGNVQPAESQQTDVICDNKGGALIYTDFNPNKLSTLPPAIGGCSGKNSPTKIPSPIHSHCNRPHSRNSAAVDSDSSIETESFLKPTQNYINSLQKRLSLDNTQDGGFDKKCNLRLNNEVQKMAHIRHNSFDDKNLQAENKLEHFQNKSLQGIDQTYINKFNQLSNPVHKIHNSPNNSPIQRASSFSTNKHHIGNIQQKVTNLNVCSVAKSNNLRNSPTLTQNNSAQLLATNIISCLRQPNHSSTNCENSRTNRNYGDTSSSEEDFDRESFRKKDLTNTRYNRAFSLRRARLDEQPQPRCPNTPEMRRKFQTADHLQSERAVSVDRRPVKVNGVQSRYLQSVTKPKIPDKIETKVPKYPVSEKNQTLSRTDSGRLSMRSTKPIVVNSPKNLSKQVKKQSGARSNSSLSSREVEFLNWRRRKSYDPMKAAAEGKKKIVRAKQESENTMTQSYNENKQNPDCDSSPSHSSSVHRSQSFHGTAALTQLISSEEDDLTLSADEDSSPPGTSPYKLSPTRMIPRQAWRGKLLN